MKVNLISLGCSKNLVDSEVLLNQISVNRFKIVNEPEMADIVIINTCGFIQDAKEESIQTILEAVKLKSAGIVKKVIVMGCLSERFIDDLKTEIPEVDNFYGTNDFKNLIKDLGGEFKKDLLGERVLTTPKHFSYLKISEGCDHPCSFCAIPLMRGGYKSRKMIDILKEAEFLSEKGVKELMIIAQDTTYYGVDNYGKQKLPDLIDKLAKTKYFEWIRILYTYPARFPLDLLNVINTYDNVCKYLDIPIQHISDNVLKSMRRGITKKATYDLLYKIRKEVPEIALRTTLITGYPNETEEDFEELTDFVKDFKFERLGVFIYSEEEGTPAFELGDPVPKKIKVQRQKKLLKIQKEISNKNNSEFVGKTLNVLIDEIKDNLAFGRTQWDAPEIDNEVILNINSQLKTGDFVKVEIESSSEYELYGKIK